MARLERKYEENKKESYTIKVFEKDKLKHIIYPNCKEAQKAEKTYWENLGYKTKSKKC